MFRSLVIVVSLLLAGCAEGESPDAGSGSVEGDVEVQSNESTNVAAPELDAQADTTGPLTVTVAGQTVTTRAVVTDIESGDRSCYLTLRTDSGATETVYADYSVCDSDAIVDRRVQIEYEEAGIMAESCEGDPECLDTETVALAIVAEPIDG